MADGPSHCGGYGQHSAFLHEIGEPDAFAQDTLDFHQWLQFVLIARLRQMMLLQMALPTQSALYAMATEVYKQELAHHGSLLDTLAALDEALTGQPVDRQP